ncbi:ribonuclease domain-containing protein [Streptomyces griseocarneus]|uniref:ribonuclease domain-containing protein n=1 Tax=Streptomyces griseocarneus TaxID=51201 RepID=UPI00167D6C07|nr:ribonuclease domain-containing protein [Streptomyces griseocarneus]MBZ6472700.1 ribonuclease [Streptomyces griseocarneus]
MTTPQRPVRFAALIALTSTLLLGTPAVAATHSVAAPAAASAPAMKVVGDICYSDLPSQAHDTIRLIDQGGPFPYPKDGTVFTNREGVLPKQSSGYYHEYTVITPGSPDRGARRVVAGKKAHEDYYTGDHYRTFDLVDFSC